MRYEEALKLMKNHDYWAESSVIDEAAEIAVSALAKQIPQKPNDIGWLGGYKVGACPRCGEGTNYDMCFCHKCGQALDWKETV